MLIYITRRVLWLVPVLWFVATVTFVLMHAVPGGPFDQEAPRTAGTARNLELKYGLAESLPTQYVRYMRGLATGDLGISFQYQDRAVTEVLGEGIGPTATLGLLTSLYVVIVGVPLGALAALRERSLLDSLSIGFATLGASLPSFVLAIFLVTVLSVRLNWTPVVGWGDVSHAILPVIALGSLPASYIARITRAAMIEVRDEDYVRTARAKGLQERTVVLRHMARNALIPVLSLIGPITANLVTGSFIIEQVFAIPGIGRAFVQAGFARDYGVIMGATLFYAAVVAIANLVVDVLYGVVDPRIRAGRA
ncbi:MAG: ABC transporter permease [Chloroflexota bacterium]